MVNLPLLTSMTPGSLPIRCATRLKVPVSLPGSVSVMCAEPLVIA